MPGIPGIKQQIHLTINLILTPALDALLSVSINSLSVKEFIFNMIFAGRLFLALSISVWIFSIKFFFNPNGATNNCLYSSFKLEIAMFLKNNTASSPMALLLVIKL